MIKFISVPCEMAVYPEDYLVGGHMQQASRGIHQPITTTTTTTAVTHHPAPPRHVLDATASLGDHPLAPAAAQRVEQRDGLPDRRVDALLGAALARVADEAQGPDGPELADLARDLEEVLGQADLRVRRRRRLGCARSGHGPGADAHHVALHVQHAEAVVGGLSRHGAAVDRLHG